MAPIPKQPAASPRPSTIYAGLLEDAVMDGDLAKIAHQLQGGVSPDHRSNQFGALVAMAVGCGQPDALRALLAAGAQPDATDNLHRPALCVAATLGRLDIAHILLDHGASLDPGVRDASNHPLFAATLHGQAAALRFLFERGARVDLADSDGRTALMWAIQKGQAECARVCLAFGADIDAQDIVGNTSAMFGLTSTADAMLALCERGFDLSIRTHTGDNVEDRAARIPPQQLDLMPGAKLFLAWRLSSNEAKALASSAPPPDTGSKPSAPRI